MRLKKNNDDVSVDNILQDMTDLRDEITSDLSSSLLEEKEYVNNVSRFSLNKFSISNVAIDTMVSVSASSSLTEDVAVSVVSADSSTAVYLPYIMPESDYMYGCTATSMGMLLGYYDYYGYLGYDLSNIIEGDIELDSRASDEAGYSSDDEFNSVLRSAIATERHVSEFFGTTSETEYSYTFVEGTTDINTENWDCIADYLGTNQYWRNNEDYGSTYYFYYNTEVYNVAYWLSFSDNVTISDDTYSVSVSVSDIDFLCGLYSYIEAMGYTMDTTLSGTYLVEKEAVVDGQTVTVGWFTFEDYMAEIDAGRAVLIQVDGHTMVGYGYDATTQEIIFDDTYESGQSMTWGGTYYYAGEERSIIAISVIAFETDGLSQLEPEEGAPEYPTVTQNITESTTENVIVTADFDDSSVKNEYSFDGINYVDYTDSITIEDNCSIYFRSTNEDGLSSVYIYKVDNIDLVAPDKPLVYASDYAETTNAVDVFAIYNLDAVIRQYSFDGETWLDYVSSVTVIENTTIYFRGIDAVGNVSEISSYTVDNIVGVVTVKQVYSDFTGDYCSDILIADSNTGNVVYWVDGDSSNVVAAGSTNLSTYNVIGIGDFTGDDKSDILWMSDTGVVGRWDDGSSDNWVFTGEVDTSSATFAGVANFDIDTKSDILWHLSNNNVGYWKDGSSANWEYIGTSAEGWSILGTGDFDGNLEADIIWQADDSSTIGFWMNGTTEWKYFGTVASSDWSFVGVGKFDANGSDAIIWQNSTNGQVGIWQFDSDENTSWTLLSIVSSDWSFAGVVDLDGNGISDILWQSTVDNSIGVWQDGDSTKWSVPGSISSSAYIC